MQYLDGENDDQIHAVKCVLLMATFEMTARIVDKVLGSVRNVVSNNLTVSIKGLLYAKLYTISTSTDKKYGKGEMTNLIDNDSWTISHIAWLLPQLVSIPFLLITSSYTLYMFVGHVFWFAVIVMA